MKPWIYIFITTDKLNFAKMSVTTFLHLHDNNILYQKGNNSPDSIKRQWNYIITIFGRLQSFFFL